MSLTKKQKQVYDYICEYLDENGFSPTQAEIKEHFSFKSLGSVQDYIKYLKNSGHLISDANSVRGLAPTNIDKSEESVPLPLFGKVAAGQPIEAIEGNEFINVPPHMIHKGEHYALEVSGNSMIEDGIFNGDTVIIKSQKSAYNGETVVALIDNEATIKRFYKKSGQIELHPANETMSPIIVKSGNLEIKGVLVGLIRSY